MSSSRAWVIYSVLRIGLFIGVFALLSILGVDPFLAALIAAVLGLCVTYIFFRRQREQVVSSYTRWRTTTRSTGDADGDAEDAALDGTQSDSPPDDAGSAPAIDGGSDGDPSRIDGDRR